MTDVLTEQADVASRASILPASWLRRMALWLGLCLFFLLAAIVQTWPMILHMSDRMMDTPWSAGDAWNLLWDLWWVRFAIVDLQTNPLHTDYLYFPQGANLYLHALIPVNGVLSIPLQLVTGNLIFSSNVVLLLSIVASGLGTFALVHRITGNHIAALVSAYVFAFMPATMVHIQGGQWNLSTTWPMPLFALFLLNTQETGRLRDAIGAGFCWALLTYNWLEFGIDAGMFFGLFLLFWSSFHVQQRDWTGLSRMWRGGVVVAASWLLLSSPLIIGAYGDAFAEDVPQADGLGEYWSIDLLAFVSPSPLWGPGTIPEGPGFTHLGIGNVFGTAYLGVTPLLLAGIALALVRRTGYHAVFWTLVFLLFATLALGPYLYIGGSKTHSVLGASFTIPLPDQLLDNLPIFEYRKMAARILVFGFLGLSVIAGLGCHTLTSWLGSTRWRKFAPAAGLVILSLIALEYWNPPVHLSPMRSPPVLEAIAGDPGQFSVVHLPLGRVTGNNFTGDWGGGITNYYQTLHEKPSFGGYLSRANITDMVWLSEEEPVIRYLACSACVIPQTPEEMDPAAVREVFLKHRIKYVAVHRLMPNYFQLSVDDSMLRRWDTYLQRVAGLQEVYRDPDLTLYKNANIH